MFLLINQFSFKKIKCLWFLLLIYGRMMYYLSFVSYKICRLLMTYYPENRTPDIGIQNQIDIQNIQYVSADSLEIKDITKKGKILIKMLWDDKMRHNGGIMLHEFVRYLTSCVLLYIDYKIERKKDIKQKAKTKFSNRFKKIIDTKDMDRPVYINLSDERISIPFGEIIFK